MHERVAGELPADAGVYGAGTPYSAFDPELMLWTVAVTFDSAWHFYELLVRRLSDVEREQLWQDYRRFGALFGMLPPHRSVEERRFGSLYGPQTFRSSGFYASADATSATPGSVKLPSGWA